MAQRLSIAAYYYYLRLFFPWAALALGFLARAERERDWELACAAKNVRYDPPGSMPPVSRIGRVSVGYADELGPDRRLAAQATRRRRKAMWYRISRAGGFDVQSPPETEPGPEAAPVCCPACGHGFFYREWEEQPAYTPHYDDEIALAILAGKF